MATDRVTVQVTDPATGDCPAGKTGSPRQIHELPGGRLAVVGEHDIHIINS
jgi:hypothetical protein